MNFPLDHRLGRGLRLRARLIGGLGGVVALGLAAAAGYAAISNVDNGSRRAIGMLGGNPARAAEGRALAVKTLQRHPYNPALLSALALRAQERGDHKAASRLMRSSASLSWRDARTNAWFMERRSAAGEFGPAAKRIDALLRVHPDVSQRLFPQLIRASADPRMAAALADRLALRPDWRGAFLYQISGAAPPETTFGILQRLQNTKAPPKVDEASAYVRRLVDLQRFDEALLGALLFMPGDRLKYWENLFNGEFDAVQGIAPFDWSFFQVAGASTLTEPSPSRPGDRALHVSISGASKDMLAYQIMALTPGAYRFGMESQAQLFGGSAPEWVIRCTGSADALIVARIGANPRWSKSIFEFSVPEQRCNAQVIELRAGASATEGATEAWFDKLTVEWVEQP